MQGVTRKLGSLVAAMVSDQFLELALWMLNAETSVIEKAV